MITEIPNTGGKNRRTCEHCSQEMLWNSCRKFVWIKICYSKFEGNLKLINTNVSIWAQQHMVDRHLYYSQRRRNIDNWGGGGGGQIFIYSCSAQLIYFEIDCFYSLWTRIYEYLPPQLSIFRRLWLLRCNAKFLTCEISGNCRTAHAQTMCNSTDNTCMSQLNRQHVYL
jgi:hypothetical protein